MAKLMTSFYGSGNVFSEYYVNDNGLFDGEMKIYDDTPSKTITNVFNFNNGKITNVDNRFQNTSRIITVLNSNHLTYEKKIGNTKITSITNMKDNDSSNRARLTFDASGVTLKRNTKGDGVYRDYVSTVMNTMSDSNTGILVSFEINSKSDYKLEAKYSDKVGNQIYDINAYTGNGVKLNRKTFIEGNINRPYSYEMYNYDSKRMDGTFGGQQVPTLKMHKQ
ncbi:MAG: hypothetical protein ACRC92_27150 [Peptostreptococcaceae bacterium]